MKKQFGSRKFLIALVSLLFNGWLVYEGVIDSDAYKTIIIAIVGAYMTANVSQKVWSKDPADLVTNTSEDKK